jgi:hypothetical protein
VIAAPLPGPQGSHGLVVGIGGISEVMRAREAELAGMLTGCIDARLGQRLPQADAIEGAIGDPMLQAILRSRRLPAET